MDHITVNGQVVPIPSNWTDAAIQNFAQGIKSSPDHITVNGQSYAVPSTWSDQSIRDYAQALKSGAGPAAPATPHDTGVLDYLKNTTSKTAHALNVENTLSQISAADSLAGQGKWSEAWDQIRGLLPGATPSQQVLGNQQGSTLQEQRDFVADTYHKAASGDLSGATANALTAALANAEQAPAVAGRAAEIARNVSDGAQKYGARVRENAPQFRQDVGAASTNAYQAAKSGVTQAAITGHLVAEALPHDIAPYVTKPLAGLALLKSAYDLHRAGVYGDLRDAVTDLFTKKTLAELQEANDLRRRVWDGAPSPQDFPDIEAEQAPETPAVSLPSGRKPGGLQNQAEAPAPVRAARPAPAWQNIAVPANDAPVPVSPVEVSLPSGRKPGGLQNQVTAVEKPTETPVKPTEPLENPTKPEAKPNENPTLAPAVDPLAALPEDARQQYEHAVQNDHPSIAARILKLGTALDPREIALYAGGDNKARVFTSFLQQHPDSTLAPRVESAIGRVHQFMSEAGLSDKASNKQITAAAEGQGRLDVVDALRDVQSVADQAHQFAQANGLPAGQKGYVRISPATWDLVRGRLGIQPGDAGPGPEGTPATTSPETAARRTLFPAEGNSQTPDAVAPSSHVAAEATATAPAHGDERGIDAGSPRESGALSGPDRASEGQASPRGADTSVRVPGSSRQYQARYALRELVDVQPSHNGLNFQPNPKYGLKNDRNYNDPINQAKVVEWSSRAKFDPTYHITDVNHALDGPVVVDRDGNALGGNGRSMILQNVYAHNAEGAAAYRALLEKKARQFGLDPADVRAMKEPVLVREVDESEFRPNSGKSKAAAITDFNVKGTADLKPSERAIADSRRVSERTLSDVASRLEAKGSDATLAEVLEGKSGVEVLNHHIDDGVVAMQERAAFAKQDTLTPEGKSRIGQLIVGRFFHDPAQLEALAPSIRQKVEKLAAPLAQVEGLGRDWNLTPHVQDALEILDGMRAAGSKNLDDFLRQDGLFGTSKYSPATVTIARALLDQNPNDLVRAARQYAADAQFAAKGETMFGTPPTPAEAFESAFGKAKSGAEREAEALVEKAKAKPAPTPEPAPKPAPKPKGKSLKDL